MIVFLDSSIVYSLVNTSKVKEVIDCQEWFFRLLSKSVLFISSVICEYEVKRELIRRNKIEELNNLKELKKWLEFLPIDEIVLDLAAKNWAKARNSGFPTADNKSLDADMIICSTWQLLQEKWQVDMLLLPQKMFNI